MITDVARSRLRQLIKAGMKKHKAISEVMREFDMRREGITQQFIKDKKGLEALVDKMQKEEENGVHEAHR